MRKYLLVILFMLAAGNYAHACSCDWGDDWTIEKHFEQTEFIFRGVVKKIHNVKVDGSSDQLNRRSFIVVTEDLKGSAADGVLLHYLQSNGANCGLSLEVGKEYQVFAWMDEELGVVVTNTCSGTSEVRSQSESSWNRYRELANQ